MGQVLIRNLDDEVIESFRFKAKVNGRSLEQELRDILTKAAPFTVAERIKMSEWLQSGMKMDITDFKPLMREGHDDEFFKS